MIKKSYIEHDKRKKVIIRTDRGIEVTDKFYNSFVNHLSVKISKLSDADLVLMESAINILSKINLT